METKPLDRLEAKVRRLVKALEAAREENLRLREELGSAPAGARAAEPPGQGVLLDARLSALQEERAVVRDRVERVISMLEDAS